MDKIRFYSFWKPERIDSGEWNELSTIPKGVGLLTFGQIEEVVKKLLTIPRMKANMAFLTISDRPVTRLIWETGDGVVLTSNVERRSDLWQIFGINVISTVSDADFIRLFVQVHERFSCVLLHESERQFLTVQQFKKRVSR